MEIVIGKLEKWLLRRVRGGADPGEVIAEMLLEKRGTTSELDKILEKHGLERSDIRWELVS